MKQVGWVLVNCPVSRLNWLLVHWDLSIVSWQIPVRNMEEHSTQGNLLGTYSACTSRNKEGKQYVAHCGVLLGSRLVECDRSLRQSIQSYTLIYPVYLCHSVKGRPRTGVLSAMTAWVFQNILPFFSKHITQYGLYHYVFHDCLEFRGTCITN